MDEKRLRLNARALAIAFVSLLSVTLLMGGILMLSLAIDVSISTTFGRDLVRAGAIGTIFGMLVFGIVFASLVYLTVADGPWAHRRSSLLPPFITAAAVLYALLLVASVNSLDLLWHDLTPVWLIGMQPEIRVVLLLIYLALPVTFAWLETILLDGRGIDSWRVALGYLFVVMVIVCVMAVGYFHFI